VYQLDKEYFDSDLSLQQVHNRHVAHRFSLYFTEGSFLRGYAFLENRENVVYLEWIVAPKSGRVVMEVLIAYLRRYSGSNLLELIVSMDESENSKAAVARLNLYYSLGFYGVNMNWSNDSRAILKMRLKIK
jgi:hypothetical protein